MSTALAQQSRSTAVAVKQPSNFELTLQEYEPQLVAVLPPHIPVEKFKRVIITAVNQNPDLAAADRRSLFTSCVKAAQDGLLPDGREAALVIFNTKVKREGKEVWINAVQYMPMIAGIRKRMRNTGEVLSADAAVVYKNDEFDYELGDNQFIKHKPTMADPGPAIGAYAIIKLANGEIIRDVMGAARIEKARAVSKSKNGPAWTNWWDEMACKTVLRHASKAAPVSAELERILLRDDDLAGEPRETLTASLAPPRPHRADFSEAQTPSESDAELTGDIANEVATEMGHDPDTGEIADQNSPAAGGNTADAPTDGADPVAGSHGGAKERQQPKRDEDFFAGEDLEIPAPRHDDRKPDWHGWGARMVALIEVAKAGELDVLRSHNATSRQRCLAAADPKIVGEVDRAFAAAEKLTA